MTDPTTPTAPPPDDLARLFAAVARLLQRAHSIGGHVVSEPVDVAALRDALAPARAEAERLRDAGDTGRRAAAQDEIAASVARRAVEIIKRALGGGVERYIYRQGDKVYIRWGYVEEDIKALAPMPRPPRRYRVRHSTIMQRWRRTHTEKLAAIRAQLVASARADRLAAERDAGQQREAALAVLLSELQEAARECADDLASELEHRYEGMLDYRAVRDDYHRDMEPVTRLRALFATLSGADAQAQGAALLEAARAVLHVDARAYYVGMGTAAINAEDLDGLLAAADALRAAGLALDPTTPTPTPARRDAPALAWLRAHGQHPPTCAAVATGGRCDCGLSKLRGEANG